MIVLPRNSGTARYYVRKTLNRASKVRFSMTGYPGHSYRAEWARTALASVSEGTDSTFRPVTAMALSAAGTASDSDAPAC